MDSAASVGTMIVVLFFTVIIALFLQSEEEALKARIAARVKMDKSDLMQTLKVRQSPDDTAGTKYVVQMLRHSGYCYDDYSKVFKDSYHALNYACQRMANARHYDFCIVKDEPDFCEIETYYGSTASRRSGKYMGGFTIERIKP